MRVSLVFFLLAMGMTNVNAFVVGGIRSTTHVGSMPIEVTQTTTTTIPCRHSVVTFLAEVPIETAATATVILTDDQVAARTAFYIWFFGASGAAGVARSAFPRMYNNIREIQSYRNVHGSTKTKTNKEEMVGISPLCGYPRDLAVSDVQAILQNKLSIEQMVLQYPVEDNLWAKKGYITYQAFRQANRNVDPLAVRAVFDCFSQSTEVSNPDIAQAKLDRYKESLENFKSDLLYSKAVGWAAIATLLGLLGLADVEAFNYAYEGWFPDWPGGRLWLEGGLWDPEIGLLSIPKYWI